MKVEFSITLGDVLVILVICVWSWLVTRAMR